MPRPRRIGSSSIRRRSLPKNRRRRGEPLEVGAKALVVKVDETFRIFVLCADRQLDSGALKKHFGAKKTRFATADELRELTGLVPGSVPPFGPPVLPLELYADEEVGRRTERVAFNAGELTTSIVLAAADWERIAAPKRIALIKS
ncbi:MAG: YbaK/EbsC family protein [Pirellulales bacterium]